MKPIQKKPFKDGTIKNSQDPDYRKNKYILVLNELVTLKEKELKKHLKKKKDRG